MPTDGKSKDHQHSKILVRFHNATQDPVNILWINKQQEKVYRTLDPSQSYRQSTYKTHQWRVRSAVNNALLADHTVLSPATILIQQDNCTVTPGLGNSITLQTDPIPHPSNPQDGFYRQRDTLTCGLTIHAYDCVSDESIAAAKETIENMLKDVKPEIIDRMNEYGAQIAIIGRNQVTTDIPCHWYLKNKQTADGRDYDVGTRGLGGNISNPVTTCGEENILMCEGNRYKSESILVHEFAHCIMNIGLHDHYIYSAIELAYEDAQRRAIYNPDAYIAYNKDEYFAEASQAWFEATIREDVTSCTTTRELLKEKDPLMACIMASVYGDGEWRYTQTAPGEFVKRTGAGKKGSGGAKSLGRWLSLPFRRRSNS